MTVCFVIKLLKIKLFFRFGRGPLCLQGFSYIIHVGCQQRVFAVQDLGCGDDVAPVPVDRFSLDTADRDDLLERKRPDPLHLAEKLFVCKEHSHSFCAFGLGLGCFWRAVRQIEETETVFLKNFLHGLDFVLCGVSTGVEPVLGLLSYCRSDFCLETGLVFLDPSFHRIERGRDLIPRAVDLSKLIREPAVDHDTRESGEFTAFFNVAVDGFVEGDKRNRPFIIMLSDKMMKGLGGCRFDEIRVFCDKRFTEFPVGLSP